MAFKFAALPMEWPDIEGKRVSFSYNGEKRIGVVVPPRKGLEHVFDNLTLKLESDRDGKLYKSFTCELIEKFRIED
jgi:hypothetical protein